MVDFQLFSALRHLEAKMADVILSVEGEGRRDRRCLTLRERKMAIELHDSGDSARKIAEQLGCGKTQIQNAIRNKQKIFDELDGNIPQHTKRRRSITGNEKVNEMTYEWYLKAMQEGITVTGPLLQKAALMFAADLGRLNFKGSNGWLESFMKSRNITLRPGSSSHIDRVEANSSTSGVTDGISLWRMTVPNVIRGYSPHDIFAMTETGLQYKDTTNATLTTNGEEGAAGSLSENRLTVALCCNATGERIKPLVIGKRANPACFGGMAPCLLPAKYEVNRNACMTSALFTDWAMVINEKMKKDYRTILVFVDDTPCHPRIALSNVQLIHWPLSETGVQPFDQGITQRFKKKFRELQLTHVLAKIKSTSVDGAKILEEISILDVINWVSEAWKDLETSAIAEGFVKCGFHQRKGMTSIPRQYDSLSNDCLEQVAEQLFGCSFEELVAFDRNFITVDKTDCKSESNEVISESTVVIQDATCAPEVNAQDSIKPIDGPDTPEQMTTEGEAMSSLQKLKSFAVIEGHVALTNALLHVEILLDNHVAHGNNQNVPAAEQNEPSEMELPQQQMVDTQAPMVEVCRDDMNGVATDITT